MAAPGGAPGKLRWGRNARKTVRWTVFSEGWAAAPDKFSVKAGRQPRTVCPTAAEKIPRFCRLEVHTRQNEDPFRHAYGVPPPPQVEAFSCVLPPHPPLTQVEAFF